MTDDRLWLLHHLNDQAHQLQSLTAAALAEPDDHSRLAKARDELFTIRETLDTLGVPLALVSNDEWSIHRVIFLHCLAHDRPLKTVGQWPCTPSTGSK